MQVGALFLEKENILSNFTVSKINSAQIQYPHALEHRAHLCD